MPRALTMTLASLLALATTTQAWAQGWGSVYYTSGTAMYKVAGDGTGAGLVTTTPAQLSRPGARADYPGGRMFTYKAESTTLPIPDYPYYSVGELHVWNQAGSKEVTAFAPPLYYRGASNWSNDGQDSFLSFVVYNASTGLEYLCRARVSGDQLASPDFPPLVNGDPRLELITSFRPLGLDDHAWHASGTKLYYLDVRTAPYRLRVKVVGDGRTMDQDQVLFDQGLTGVRPYTLAVSPFSEQVVLEGNNTKTGVQGLLSLDPVSGRWAWLVSVTYKPNFTPVNAYANPVFSPDGTGVAFFFKRADRKATYYGISKMPANGGPATVLTQSTVNGYNLKGWTW